MAPVLLRDPRARPSGRSVKEVHETLYHFHKPETELQANQWLHNYLSKNNQGEHRSEPQTRIEDWWANLPSDGLREMCLGNRSAVSPASRNGARSASTPA